MAEQIQSAKEREPSQELENVTPSSEMKCDPDVQEKKDENNGERETPAQTTPKSTTDAKQDEATKLSDKKTKAAVNWKGKHIRP